METLLHMAALVAAALVPLLLLRAGLFAYSRVAPTDADAVPLLHVAGIGIGMLAGIGLLAALPHADAFAPARVLLAEGAWAIGLAELLLRHVLPDAATLDVAWHGALAGRPALVAWPVRLAIVLALALMLHAYWLWRGRLGLRAALAALLLILWAALLLHQLAHLLAWGVSQANIWAVLLALLLWQRWRYAPPRRH